MPSTISNDFKAALKKTFRPGLALRIVRADGAVFAFNNQTLGVTLPELAIGTVTVPETTYQPGHCRFPANVQKSTDIRKSDSWEWVALLDGYVMAADVMGKKFLGARYTFIVYNREDTTQQLLLMRGKVGEVTVSGGEAKFSMRGLADGLQQEILEVTSATSNKVFGDPELDFFDLDGNTDDGFAARVTGTINSVDSEEPRRVFTLTATEGFPVERFTNGTARFLDGDNEDFEAGIIIWDDGEFTLDRDTPAPMQAGDGVRVQIGAPVTIEAWRTMFGTGFGFPAEPGIPTAERVAEVQK